MKLLVTKNCIVSDEWIRVNTELERMWKEAIAVQLKVLSQHGRKEMRKTATDHRQDSQCFERDSNRAPLEYEPRALLLKPHLLMPGFGMNHRPRSAGRNILIWSPPKIK